MAGRTAEQKTQAAASQLILSARQANADLAELRDAIEHAKGGVKNVLEKQLQPAAEKAIRLNTRVTNWLAEFAARAWVQSFGDDAERAKETVNTLLLFADPNGEVAKAEAAAK